MTHAHKSSLCVMIFRDFFYYAVFVDRSGTCQFYVKYLGCCEVFESRGMQVKI